MSSFEFNKIFAAVLVAGIVAMLSGFIAKKVVYPEKLKKDAVTVEGGEVSGGAISNKPKLPDPIAHLIAEASVEKGAKLAKACAACHSFEKGGPVKQGPNMWNTLDSNIGKKPGFDYSDTLANATGQWDYASLNQFLAKPKAYMPGTKMNFVGLKKAEDRADVVAWLRTLADSPVALPTEAQIAAEKALLAPEEEETAEEQGAEDRTEQTVDNAEGKEESAVTPHAGEPTENTQDTTPDTPEVEKQETETPATEDKEAKVEDANPATETAPKQTTVVEEPQAPETMPEPAAGETPVEKTLIPEETKSEEKPEAQTHGTATQMKTSPIQVFETLPAETQQQ